MSGMSFETTYLLAWPSNLLNASAQHAYIKLL